MALVIRALHPAATAGELNQEWILVENTGPGMIHSAGWALLVGKGTQRPHPLGTLSPGFPLQPGEKIRLITGSPSKKAWGTPPPDGEDGMKNYYLFLREPVLARSGLVIRIALKQLELARATYAADGKDGLAA